MNLPQHLFANPEFYPAGIDIKRYAINFIRMSREAYEKSSFLDDRLWRTSAEECSAGIEDLFCLPVPARPRVCYVLHSAFCCSTLLARYLQLIPSCFVLKEPLLLTQIAMAMPDSVGAGESNPIPDVDPYWLRVLDLSLDLLGRVYIPGQTVIIKAAPACNSLGQLLLERDERSRIVFVSIALRTFILSTLKSAGRRQWLRQRLPFLTHVARSIPELAGIDPRYFSDSKVAAYQWLVNESLRGQLTTGANSSRVITFDGEAIAETPGSVVRSVSRHFDLIGDDYQIEELMGHETARRHSKTPAALYDANTRRAEFTILEGTFGAEAQTGIEWVESVRIS